ATNAGFRQFLTVLSVTDGRIVSQVEVGKADSKEKLGLYYGLVFGKSVGPPNGSASGREIKWTLYASRGAEERIAVYELDHNGILSDPGRSLKAPSGVAAEKSPNHIAGIAHDLAT